MSKRTVQFARFFIVCASCLFDFIEKANVSHLTVRLNSSTPLAGWAEPMNSFETRSVFLSLAAITFILGMRTFSKIYSSVIEAIVIPMISLFTRFTSKNLPVHANQLSFSSTNSIESSASISTYAPVVCRQPFKIIDINDGNFSLREGNVSVRLIKRLIDFVSRNTGFKHFLPPSRLCISRYSISFFLFLLAFSQAAYSQSGFTQVKATVLDPNGVPYAGCHGNSSFVPSPSATTIPTIGGSTFQTDVPINGCDSFGAFTTVLADNNVVQDGHTSPPASQWRFNISSQDGKTSFFCIITITGLNQNITVPLQACAPPLGGGGGGGGNKGSMYRFNIAGSTPLVAGNFSFNGWGTGATIGGITGTDTAFTFTMTAGTTPSINPTVTLTFADGPWTNIYSVNAQTDNGSGDQTFIQSDATLTTVKLTYLNLPEATKTYTITATVVGTTNVGNVANPVNAVVMNPAGTQTVIQPSGSSLNVNRFENVRNSDQFSSLQAAVSDCPSGCEVYVPVGTVSPSSLTTINQVLWIHGAGIGKTIIKPANVAAFSITASGTSVKVSDLTIDMTNASGQTALAFSGVNKPIIENVQILYPSTTGTGTAISEIATAEMHMRNVIIKGAGICVDENGNASGENFYDDIVCEDPGTYGYHRTQTTSTDIGGEYLTHFKVTNPDNRATAQGFVVSSTAANTGSPFFCLECIGDNMRGGHTYQIHNMVNVFLTGIWATNGASSGSNFAAVNLDTVTNAFVRGGYIASLSRDLVFTGTNTTVELTNNLFAGTNTNIFLTGSTTTNIHLFNPVFSASTPMSAADLSTLVNNANTAINANGWHVGVSGSQGPGPTLSICDEDVGDATPCVYVRTTSGGGGAFQILNNSSAQIFAVNKAGTVATLGLTQPLTQTIANGNNVLGTSSITNGTCATTITVSAPGVQATDGLVLNPQAAGNAFLTYEQSFLTTNNVNLVVCNPSAAPVTPSAVTLYWRVVR